MTVITITISVMSECGPFGSCVACHLQENAVFVDNSRHLNVVCSLT